MNGFSYYLALDSMTIHCPKRIIHKCANVNGTIGMANKAIYKMISKMCAKMLSKAHLQSDSSNLLPASVMAYCAPTYR